MRQMPPAAHSAMRFAADAAATSFPQGSTVQGVVQNLLVDNVRQKPDPNFGKVYAQNKRVAAVLEHLRQTAQGKSMASAQTEAQQLSQALGSVHAEQGPGQHQAILARAEQLRGLVRNLDETMHSGRVQMAEQRNAALAAALMRRGAP